VLRGGVHGEGVYHGVSLVDVNEEELAADGGATGDSVVRDEYAAVDLAVREAEEGAVAL
jgi:hypothetical protein